MSTEADKATTTAPSPLGRFLTSIGLFTPADDVDDGVEPPATNATRLTGAVTVVGAALAAGLTKLGIDFSDATLDAGVRSAGVYVFGLTIAVATIALAWIVTTDVKMRGGLQAALAASKQEDGEAKVDAAAVDPAVTVASYAADLDAYLDDAELHAAVPSDSAVEPFRFSTAAEAYRLLAEQLAQLEAPPSWKGEPAFLAKLATDAAAKLGEVDEAEDAASRQLLGLQALKLLADFRREARMHLKFLKTA